MRTDTYTDLNKANLETILKEAINRLKSQETSRTADLCLSWNRHDIARKFIFNEEYKGDVRFLL